MTQEINKQKLSFGSMMVLNAILTICIVLILLFVTGNLPGDRLSQRDIPISLQTATASENEERIIRTVREANPAVISIVVTKDVPVVEESLGPFSLFEEFFGESFPGTPTPRGETEEQQELQVGGGSGFIVSQDGLAVTNRHVVQDSDASYTAFTNDGEKYDVEVVARDPLFDIAVIRLKDATGLTYLSFGDSSLLAPGQTVIAIGNALGEFRNSVSVGVISGLSRRLVAGDRFGRSELLEEVIQTDAAINPGNSGGPLLDSLGNVIGMNVAVVLGSENIGFALPASLIEGIVTSVKEHGEIIRPYLGVRYVLINARIQELNDLPVDYGALVGSGTTPEGPAVIPGSPADKAGIVENDIILEFDGTRISEEHSLATLIRKKSVGDTVTIKISHEDKTQTKTVRLEKAP